MSQFQSKELPVGRIRRIQERTEVARANLITAGVPLFSEQGFDAVSVRDIEVAADANRGMVAYHFGDKVHLWKAVADFTFQQIDAQRDMRLGMMKDISDREGLALMIRFYVRFYAEHPELSRLMAQEARQESWRIDYLVENHIRQAVCNLSNMSEKFSISALANSLTGTILWSAPALPFFLSSLNVSAYSDSIHAMKMPLKPMQTCW